MPERWVRKSRPVKVDTRVSYRVAALLDTCCALQQRERSEVVEMALLEHLSRQGLPPPVVDEAERLRRLRN